MKNLSFEARQTAIETIRSLAEQLGVSLQECLDGYPQFGWHLLVDNSLVPPAERDWSMVKGIWIKKGYCLNIDLLHKSRMYKNAIEECREEGSYFAPQDIYDLIRDNITAINHSLCLIGKEPLKLDLLYWLEKSPDENLSSAPAYNMLHGTVTKQATIRDFEYLSIFLHQPKI